MKLRFKHQKFQEDAVKATCDFFTGQPNESRQFLVDQGNDDSMLSQLEIVGFGNNDIVINEAKMLENLREIQTQQGIIQLEHNNIERLNKSPVLTIEMETGTGKTYTYIKTIYEMYQRYGWSKFIIVVPSIAIREGVLKTFQITSDHFAEEYGKRIRYFVYNSARLNEIDHFANDSSINVMIINAQAFNSTGKDARRIWMPLDSFRGRKPGDVIAATHPIVIVDEPQSVLGTKEKVNKTRENISKFRPLFYLSYSATHRKGEEYNKVFRLDAVDAYQQQLVKKIAVKGITVSGGTTTNGYLYLQKINTYPNKKPDISIAFLETDTKTGSGVRRKTHRLKHGDDIFVHSGELEAYRNGYTITNIDARNDSGYVDFKNGIRIHEGEVIGETNANDLRRIQIRETIATHLKTESKLFRQGIKVLSLFFIDKVEKYKYYTDDGEQKGDYAKIFEEEFAYIAQDYLENELQFAEDADFRKYLEKFVASEVHAGYFSIDKKGRAIDSEIKRGEEGSSDVDAYDLIMKNKERLLSLDEPVRFIFSHSALREGWDNPNVFQICTLRESNAEIKKRQEIGRGLRLCVDQNGVRQDAETLGENLVHDMNILTVIANESYDEFASSLQSEFNEVIARRHKDISASLFNGRLVVDQSGQQKITIDDVGASNIYSSLKVAGFIDKNQKLTSTYLELSSEQKDEAVYNALDDDWKIYADNIQEILSETCDLNPRLMVDNARRRQTMKINHEKYTSSAFHELWTKINGRTFYTVDFDEDNLIQKCIEALDRSLRVTPQKIVVTEGYLKSLGKDKLEMYRDKISKPIDTSEITKSNVAYDLVNEFSKSQNDGGTSLSRQTVVQILSQIHPQTFAKFNQNPEEFIHNAKKIINSIKAKVVTEKIEYHKLNEDWDKDEVFLGGEVNGDNQNMIDTPERHLYDKLRYDSNIERDFATELEKQESVELFVKLPKQFYIETPMGKYNPDWAVAFHDDAGVKHIYFVAETKGVDELSMEIEGREIERAKIHCAKKHFAEISDGNEIYGVCSSYNELLQLVNT